MKLGPNMKDLIVHRMSMEAVPTGGGLNSALNFLSSKESIIGGLKAATEWSQKAVLAIRNATEPNPWRNASDEDIAGEIMKRVKQRGR
jgi:hypothetical protein